MSHAITVRKAAIWDDGGWFSFPRAFIRDMGLSIEARGAAAWMASHTETFAFNATFIATGLKVGRDKCRRIIAELVDAGYLTRERTKDEQGRFAEGVVYTLYPEPVTEDSENTRSNHVTENPSMDNGKLHYLSTGNQVTENQYTGFAPQKEPHSSRDIRENTHTLVDETSPDIERETVGVCVEDPEPETPDESRYVVIDDTTVYDNAQDHTDNLDRARDILNRCVDHTAARRLSTHQTEALKDLTARSLSAGHTVDSVCGRISGVTNEDTHSPYNRLEPILYAMATEKPFQAVSVDPAVREQATRRPWCGRCHADMRKIVNDNNQMEDCPTCG